MSAPTKTQSKRRHTLRFVQGHFTKRSPPPHPANDRRIRELERFCVCCTSDASARVREGKAATVADLNMPNNTCLVQWARRIVALLDVELK